MIYNCWEFVTVEENWRETEIAPVSYWHRHFQSWDLGLWKIELTWVELASVDAPTRFYNSTHYNSTRKKDSACTISKCAHSFCKITEGVFEKSLLNRKLLDPRKKGNHSHSKLFHFIGMLKGRAHFLLSLIYFYWKLFSFKHLHVSSILALAFHKRFLAMIWYYITSLLRYWYEKTTTTTTTIYFSEGGPQCRVGEGKWCFF
jgi:hypothetical protein